MESIAAVCILVLIAIGAWFYYNYTSPSHGGTREAPAVKQLKTAGKLSTELEHYLEGLDARSAAALLAENGEFMAASLWEEIGAMLASKGRVGEFTGLLKNPKPEIRTQAAEVLGYTAVPGAAQALLETLGDKNEEVRLAAGAALVRLRDPSTAVPLAQGLGNPGKLLPARVAEVLLALEENAVGPLLEEIKKAGQEGQCLICEVLGQLGNAGAVPALTELLSTSPFVKVRAAAAGALGDIPASGKEGVDALLAALGDPAWEVRSQAAKALGQSGNRDAVPSLEVVAAGDEEWTVRTMAQAALERLLLKDDESPAG